MCVIETARLTLRRLTGADARFMLDLLNEPSFIENIGDRGVRTLEQARTYIEDGPVASYARHGFGLYLVVVKETRQAAGICGLVKRDGLDDVDIGFAFLPNQWKKGYAVESALAVKNYAAAVVGLKRLVAITSPANWPSIRVLEKIGFAFEKTVRLTPEAEELKLFSCSLEDQQARAR
jgi:ribosomal-protein-alanine N-acetyltransferase